MHTARFATARRSSNSSLRPFGRARKCRPKYALTCPRFWSATGLKIFLRLWAWMRTSPDFSFQEKRKAYSRVSVSAGFLHDFEVTLSSMILLIHYTGGQLAAGSLTPC